MITKRFSCAVFLVATILVATALGQYYDNGVTITAQITVGEQTYQDGGNFAGLYIPASDTYDSGIDVPEPAPPQTNYLSLYFPHSEWGLPFFDNFMKDVRDETTNLTNAVKTYGFDVVTDQTGTVDLTFNIETGYSGALGVVLFDVGSSVYQDLAEDNTYSFTASPTHSFELSLGDATAPQISISSPGSDEILDAGSEYDVIWTATDVSPIRTTDVSYSLDNGSTWVSIGQVTGTTQQIAWTVPDSYTSEAKIKIECTDWAGNTGIETSSYTFNIGPAYSEYAFTAGWHMVSVPLIPDINTTEAIFGDDISGAYFVFDYSSSAGYSLVSTIDHGAGYWIAMETPATIDLDGTSTFDPKYLDLSPNWNLVGDAFPRPVAKTDLEFTDGITTKSFEDAVTDGWVSSAFYGYNGSYQNADSLFPWLGYWLQAVTTGLQMVTNPPSSGAVDVANLPGQIDDRHGWFVPVELFMGNLTSTISGFGVQDDATNEFDIWYDNPAPPLPPSGEFVRLSFQRPEWGAPVGDTFVQDIRAPLEPSCSVTWDGIIEASSSGELEVDFAGISQCLPIGYLATAELNGQTVDILQNPIVVIHYVEPCAVAITVSAGLTIVDLTISLEGSTATLHWGDVPGASIYHVYRSLSPSFDTGEMIQIGTTASTDFIDTEAEAESLFYRITWE
jgi:hypothetical protein